MSDKGLEYSSGTGGGSNLPTAENAPLYSWKGSRRNPYEYLYPDAVYAKIGATRIRSLARPLSNSGLPRTRESIEIMLRPHIFDKSLNTPAREKEVVEYVPFSFEEIKAKVGQRMHTPMRVDYALDRYLGDPKVRFGNMPAAYIQDEISRDPAVREVGDVVALLGVGTEQLAFLSENGDVIKVGNKSIAKSWKEEYGKRPMDLPLKGNLKTIGGFPVYIQPFAQPLGLNEGLLADYLVYHYAKMGWLVAGGDNIPPQWAKDKAGTIYLMDYDVVIGKTEDLFKSGNKF